jgi:hypothetical protein
MAYRTEDWKNLFVEEEGSPVDVMSVGLDIQIENIRFGSPVSSFMISKSDLHCKEIASSRGRVLNDPQTDILVAESLIFPCKGIGVIVVIVIGVV